MFTLTQIKTAHSQVKSGADFPAYVQDIKRMGVTFYETHVTDGHTDYYGVDGYHVLAPARYSPLAISEKCQMEQFQSELKAHQQGHTDYPTFINACARLGVAKWTVCLDEMTCTYYDLAGNKVLVEEIPG